jgi:hydroxyethylthiazole kinase-like uncharacterized protein yjeF
MAEALSHLLLPTPAEMARADHAAIAAGTPGIDLMERAGRAVADAAIRLCPLGGRIIVVAGPGNNGGDGFVAARILVERGYRTRLFLLGAQAALKGDAALAAARWSGPVEAPDETVAGVLSQAGLIIDAIFGAGLSRAPDVAAARLIAAINAAGRPVLAVDLPSGVDGATGAEPGLAVRAVETVTFVRRKPGHLLLPGRLACGKVRVADIGIGDEILEAIAPRTFLLDPDLFAGAFPVPGATSHKYTRGHAVIVAGGLETGSAARLAARAALRAGTGLATLLTPPEGLAVQAAANLAVMVRGFEGAAGLSEALADPRRNAVLIGPGGGLDAAMEDRVRAVLAAGRRTVLDADALTAFAGRAHDLAGLLPRDTVLTPHAGEFARLLADQPDLVRADRLAAVRGATGLLGAHMVLKGADTVIAAPDGRAAIAANAPPWLATAGSGDVLAGIALGLLAQGMPVFEAACAAVWLHGEAGREAGPGLISEDLTEALRPVLRRLFEGRGWIGA